MEIGDAIMWKIPAIYNGIGLASAPERIGCGEIIKIGRLYVVVEYIMTVGPNHFPMTDKISKSAIINPQ